MKNKNKHIKIVSIVLFFQLFIINLSKFIINFDKEYDHWIYIGIPTTLLAIYILNKNINKK